MRVLRSVVDVCFVMIAEHNKQQNKYLLGLSCPACVCSLIKVKRWHGSDSKFHFLHHHIVWWQPKAPRSCICHSFYHPTLCDFSFCHFCHLFDCPARSSLFGLSDERWMNAFSILRRKKKKKIIRYGGSRRVANKWNSNAYTYLFYSIHELRMQGQKVSAGCLDYWMGWLLARTL